MIYSIDGTDLANAYDVESNSLSQAFDVFGNVVFISSWENEITVEEKRNTTIGTTYYVIRIPKTRPNGQEQYPFVFAPTGTNKATQTTLQMNRQYGWKMATNAGVFNTSTIKADGIVVQNSIVIQNAPAVVDVHIGAMPLTIDSNGDLSYASANADASALVGTGIVSAVCGFFPLVVDYDAVDSSVYDWVISWNDSKQRQIIGQFENGDYCIITCEGRGFKNSVGFTIPQVIDVCLDIGLMFAYNLDGGGSTETVIGNDQINVIYEGTYGRIVPTYIVFNGTDTFSVPN